MRNRHQQQHNQHCFEDHRACALAPRDVQLAIAIFLAASRRVPMPKTTCRICADLPRSRPNMRSPAADIKFNLVLPTKASPPDACNTALLVVRFAGSIIRTSSRLFGVQALLYACLCSCAQRTHFQCLNPGVNTLS